MIRKILCFFGFHNFETIFHDDELIDNGFELLRNECKHCDMMELGGRKLSKANWKKIVKDHKAIIESCRKATIAKQYDSMYHVEYDYPADTGYAFDSATGSFYNQRERNYPKPVLVVNNREVATSRKRKPKLRSVK